MRRDVHRACARGGGRTAVARFAVARFAVARFAVTRLAVAFLAAALLGGVLPSCGGAARLIEPGDRLWFPAAPLAIAPDGAWSYDTDGDGAPDFRLRPGPDGVLDVLEYDDDRDGRFERTARVSAHDPDEVPHLVVLMDSLAYRVVRPAWESGRLAMFRAPTKVIAPFPSMSVVVFNDILHAPPMPAAVERYYDVPRGRVVNDFVGRALGHQHGWHRMLDWYLDDYLEVGASYLAPEEWIRHELHETARAFAERRGPVVVTYVSTSSGMASVRGAPGLDESLALLEQLCVQLLHETAGAIRISVVSDHGHNLTPSTRFDPEAVLEAAGFTSVDGAIDFDREVFVELDGLVTYFGVQTGRPREVADVLLDRPEVELAMYVEGDGVVIRDRAGAALVERRGDRCRYRPIDRDVLGWEPVVRALRAAGAVDADGFFEDRAALLASADHAYPDAPRRLIDAFSTQVRYPCRVMCTLHDGHHAGIETFERLVTMASTHGGLSQVHSDAVLLTMTPGVSGPLRSREVLAAVEPRYDPWGRRRGVSR